MAVVKLRRGDDFRRRVRWKGVAGAPLDLTGYAVTLRHRGATNLTPATTLTLSAGAGTVTPTKLTDF